MICWNLRRRCASPTPLAYRQPSPFTRSAAGVLSALFAAAYLVFATAAQAQTAHFGGVQTVLFSSGLHYPAGVAVDSSGNVYIADNSSSRVLKETLSGGTYTQTIIGSGLSYPDGIAVDGSGNVYIADHNNGRVVKETLSAGTYTQTIVSSGLSSPSGVAVDTSGNVYIADSNNNRILKEVPSGSTYTQSTINTSGLTNPVGVTVDTSGNVYVTDTGHNRVLKETFSSGSYSQSVIATTGLTAPLGLTVDGSGNVYIADQGNNRIVKETFSGSTYTQSVVVTGLDGPYGVALDNSGNIYIGDQTSQRIFEVKTASVNFLSSNIGTPTASTPLTFIFDTAGSLGAAPQVLTQGAPTLDFTDAGTGTCTTNGPTHAYSAGDSCTVDVVLKPRVAGPRSGAVVLSNASGVPVATAYVYGTGVGPQLTFSPPVRTIVGAGWTAAFGVAVDAAGNVYVSDAGSNKVTKETLSGGTYTPSTVTTNVNEPILLAVDGAGAIYIADSNHARVLKETPSGAGGYIESTIGSGWNAPFGVAVDGAGNVYVADLYTHQVVKETLSNGSYTQAPIVTGLVNPYGVAVDSSGNVYVADAGAGSVLLETPSGGSYTQTTIASGLNSPEGVIVDGRGDVYISDQSGSILLETPAAGGGYTQTTYLNINATDMAFDGNGNLFVIDENDQSVLQENVATLPSFTFASTALGATSSDSPQSFTLTNIGNADLTFSVPSIGTNPAISTGFSFDAASTCPSLTASSSTADLMAGESCTVGVDFSPTTLGSVSGALVFTDNNLNGQPNATQTVNLSGTATPAVQTITFPQPSSPVTYGTSSVTLAATASSGLAVSYAVTSGPGSISGATLSFTGAGTVVVTASQAGNANYAAAIPVSVSIVVNAALQTITFPQPSSPVTYGASPVTLAATDTSGLPVSYAVTSGPGSISGATLSFTGAGTVVVTASQAGNANYAAATAVSVSIVVNAASQAITFPQPSSPVTYGASVTLAATASSGLPVSYAVTSGPGSISGSTLSFTGAGTVVVTASQAGNANYTAATAVSVSIVVNAPAPAVTTTSVTATPASVTSGTSVTLAATISSSAGMPTGTVTFSTGSTSLGTATLNAGVATLATTALPVGIDTITASYGGTDGFAPSTSTTSVTVDAATAPTFTVASTTPSLSVAQGQTASTTLSLSSVGGYSGAVRLSCQGLPANASCVFAQNPVTLSGTSQAVTVGLTINTDVAQTSMAATPELRQPPISPTVPALALWLPGGLAGLAALGRRRKPGKGDRQRLGLCLLLAAAGALVGATGCGSDHSHQTPLGSSKVNVLATGTSGSSSITQSVVLTITITK